MRRNLEYRWGVFEVVQMIGQCRKDAEVNAIDRNRIIHPKGDGAVAFKV